MKLRTHLSYANVMATLAFILALMGGTTAIAIKAKAPKNSVGKKALKKNSVTTKALAPSSVDKKAIEPSTVGGSQLGPIHTLSRRGLGVTQLRCPPGERLLNGGAETDGFLRASFPKPGEEWIASGARPDGVERPVTVYITCLIQ